MGIDDKLKVFSLHTRQTDSETPFVYTDVATLDYIKNPWVEMKIVTTTVLADADLVVFNGGTDINTDLYGEERGNSTQLPDNIRDEIEKKIFEAAVNLNKPILGICRGGQLGCVLSGGRLIQDVSDHAKPHSILDVYTKNIFEVNSMHHQLMFPYELSPKEYDILQYTTQELMRPYSPQQFRDQNNQHYSVELDGTSVFIKDIAYFKQPEMILFEKTNCLAVQYHPELLDPTKYAEVLRIFNETLFNLIYETAYSK